MEWKKYFTRPLAPISVYYVAYTYTKIFKRKFGRGLATNLFVFKNGSCHSYRNRKEVLLFFKHLRKICANLDFTKKNFQLGMEITAELVDFIRRFSMKNISSLRKRQLLLLFKEFSKLYLKYWTYYGFALYVDYALTGSPNRIEGFQKQLNLLRRNPAYLSVQEKILKPLCREVAKRAFGKRSDSLLFALPPEIEAFLQGRKKLNEKLYLERERHSSIITERGHIKILAGRESEELEIKITSNKKEKEERLFGSGASSGVVRGEVKVVHSIRDLSKVAQGDILVAPMAIPSYLTAMKKAAAFVTDEGSLFCHAAIVAREMGKPCIVGTQRATRVFKDGDFVEVDGSKGIIRKL
jgi:phosphohistidine swiveling domain-containing protein